MLGVKNEKRNFESISSFENNEIIRDFEEKIKYLIEQNMDLNNLLNEKEKEIKGLNELEARVELIIQENDRLNDFLSNQQFHNFPSDKNE